MSTYIIDGKEFEVNIAGGGDYVPDKLPKGTIADDWREYADRMRHHEFNIGRERFYLDHFCNLLEQFAAKKQWTAEEIRARLKSEIDMANHCDAPNKPGYFRANND